MSSNFQNILAVIVGIIIGSIINMGVLRLTGSFIPPPEGVDPANFDSIKANIHKYELKHFIMPMLAHGIGTFIGAIISCILGVSNFKRLALFVGFWFLLGGLAMMYMIPHKVMTIDLIVAYIPMAWLAWLLVGKNKEQQLHESTL